MRRNTGCQTADHAISRRAMMAGAGSAAATAVGLAERVAHAESKQLETKQKRILQVFLQAASASWKAGTRSRARGMAVPSVRFRHRCRASIFPNCCRTSRNGCITCRSFAVSTSRPTAISKAGCLWKWDVAPACFPTSAQWRPNISPPRMPRCPDTCTSPRAASTTIPMPSSRRSTLS